jgi:hypothetical protein
VSGNPRGRWSRQERIADKLEEWTAPHGGLAAFEPAERDLLQQAVNLFLTRVRGADQRLRTAGKISRLLAQVGIVADRAARRREARSAPGDSPSGGSP